jgi:chromosome segregation ATPase
MIGLFSNQDLRSMNFRFLLLFAALGLSACNGSDSSDSSTTTTSTFDAETAVAQAKLDGLNAEIGQKTAALTAAGTKLTQTEQAEAALNTKTRAAEEKLAGVLAEADAKTKEVETAGSRR